LKADNLENFKAYRATAESCAMLPHTMRRLLSLIWTMLVLIALTHDRLPSVRAQPAGLSPEGAIIVLRPYKVIAADLPGGYQPSTFLGSSVITAVSLYSGYGPSVRSVYADWVRDGFSVWISQILNPTPNPCPDPSWTVYLMRDAAAARAYATGQVRPPHDDPSFRTYSNANLGVLPGDSGAAWSFKYLDQDNVQRGGFHVRWQRDQLVFVVEGSSPNGPNTPDELRALLVALNRKAALIGQPLLHSWGVLVPASEEQRLEAGIKINATPVGLRVPPAGFQFNGRNYSHPANPSASTNDPQAALRDFDDRWQRLIEGGSFFSDSDRVSFVDVWISVDGDAQSALFDLAARRIPDLAIDPPIALGDATIAAHEVFSLRDASIREVMSISWVHGPIVIAVSLGAPQNAFSVTTLLGFARQAEDAYQRSPFAQPPAAPSNLRARALDMNRIRLDWINNSDTEDGFAIFDSATNQIVALAPPRRRTFSQVLPPGRSTALSWPPTTRPATRRRRLKPVPRHRRRSRLDESEENRVYRVAGGSKGPRRTTRRGIPQRR
jgi:hypothetical protein